MRHLENRDYTVGWICALPVETAAAIAMLDEEHGRPDRQDPHDKNNYILGRIGSHNVVIACLPDGVYGTISAAALIVQMQFSFRSIRFGLMIGIGGGVPSFNHDIRLGDVVVSKPSGTSSGILQYDFGKAVRGKLVLTGSLNKPPKALLAAIAILEAEHLIRGNKICRHLTNMLNSNPEMRRRYTYPGTEKDRLYQADYSHVGGQTCERCDISKQVIRRRRDEPSPVIFYGTIGSGNQVVKDGKIRDELARENDILCFEMEAAGLMDNFSCLIIRGICDYSDSHKNKDWQAYAAATAAAYAKELLYNIPVSDSGSADSEVDVQDTGPRRSHSTYSDNSGTLVQRTSIASEILPPPVFILTSQLYSKEDISLASIIPDLRYPNQDALMGTQLKEGSDFSVTLDKNFSDLMSTKAKSNSAFRKTIGRLFVSPSVTEVREIQVFAEESRVYLTRQPRALFKQLCKISDVRDWLYSFCVSEESVYFIVGYRTLLNARFVGKGITTTISTGSKNDVYQTTGERIYALCFRRINSKLIKKGNMNSEILESTNHWKVLTEDRAAGDEDEYISAELDKAPELGDEDLGVFPFGGGEEVWMNVL
ncbi:hypothetical protein ABW19_dt0202579 [Dactylella cylindrospora]|nr:hypothetical protein ABW19_dt0202579 [Dactylella cylindrospora]